MTTAEYVQENWGYFGQTWRGVTAAIRHYTRNPGDLKNEVVGVNAFKDRRNLEERDISSAKIKTAPNPNQSYGELISHIRELHAAGADPETIQRVIGPVPELSDVPGDRLAISSIMIICGTGQPLWAKLGKAKVMK